MEKQWYTIKEAAEYLGVTRKTLYAWMADGRLPFIWIGDRRKITHEALQGFIKPGVPSGVDQADQKNQAPWEVASYNLAT
jgi:excisionase family DNA binding protein